jgi:LysR family glycine cleavage system transcriptional activator
MPRSLPFLNGLRAFEAAARHGSFAAGGAELHISPAAVSRLVRLLEQRMGIALFERGANRLALTVAGAAYRAGLGALFDELERLTVATVAQAGQRTLILGVGPSFAAHWLIPRLADWHARAPGLQVRVTTGGAAAAFDEGWSCGIRLGDGDWPGFVATPLFAADLLPVCAPALAAGLAEPAQLAKVSLLRVAHAAEDWPLWLAAQGLAGKVAARGPVFDFYGQAQQAAADGLGVAMGIRPYIDDALRQGRLVAPFAAPVPKGEGWFLIHRPRREEDPAFAAFRAWIVEAAKG